jgi:hypothetical protein
MALMSTQPLAEMSTRNVSWWVKAADAHGLPYRLQVSTIYKSGSAKLLKPPGPVVSVYRVCFTFTSVLLEQNTETPQIKSRKYADIATQYP